MPLDKPPPRETRLGSPLELSRVHWVRPEVVVEVTYLTWTEGGLLRAVTRAAADVLPRSRLQHRRDVVGKLTHGVADRGHQARNVRRRQRLRDRDVASRVAPRPVELDRHLGNQDQVARPVGIQPLDVDADAGVGVEANGTGFAINRTARQT